jgi:hypothetical protein
MEKDNDGARSSYGRFLLKKCLVQRSAGMPGASSGDTSILSRGTGTPRSNNATSGGDAPPVFQGNQGQGPVSGVTLGVFGPEEPQPYGKAVGTIRKDVEAGNGQEADVAPSSSIIGFIIRGYCAFIKWIKRLFVKGEL